MLKRIKLCERKLPNYTVGEEVMNMVTHIVGAATGISILLLCTLKAIIAGNAADIIGATIYGVSMITLYTISSIYHGLHPCTGKKVMQILDHCSIYVLIAGTYTPILLSAFIPVYPVLGWGLLGAQWCLATVAITLTAIDLRKYRVFSMICYIGMGWCIIFFLPQTLALLTAPGFLFLLLGGIAYTIGAILFAIGSKLHWFHSVFHIFTVIGSILQFAAIYLYVL